MKTTSVIGCLVTLMALGCAANAQKEEAMAPGSGPEMAGPEVSAVQGDDLPPAVATITLENGSTVDFYDAKIGALIIARGKADVNDHMVAEVNRTIDANQGAAHLVDLYEALLPNVPVPQSIVELQDRLTHGPVVSLPALDPPVDVGRRAEGTSAVTAQIQPGSVAGGVAQALAPSERTLIGCNNGCCDPTWTYNSVCNYGYSNMSWRWYDFNYNWTTVNTGSGTTYAISQVCAAVGTTSWTWGRSDTCGGVQYHWTVAEGYYSGHWYSEGTFCYGGYMWSNTNSSSSPHLHTHCGGANY